MSTNRFAAKVRSEHSSVATVLVTASIGASSMPVPSVTRRLSDRSADRSIKTITRRNGAMRTSWLTIALVGLLNGCDTTGGNGVLGSVMGQVGSNVAGTVMQRTVGAVATSAPVATATREVCGSDSWGLC